MKRFLMAGAAVLGIFLGTFAIASAATILFPGGGGTGTNIVPTYGQVLVGTASGIYQPQATSTLGFSGGSGAVSSVFGRTGAVVATAGDYTTAMVTEATNLYFTAARVLATTLSGFSATTGTVTSSDTVLTALEKLAGNAATYLTNITGYISAGTNVTISGSGTSGSPYVINATGGSGSGTVSSGLAGQNAYYAANGTTVVGTSTIFIAPSGNIIEGTVACPNPNSAIVGGTGMELCTNNNTAGGNNLILGNPSNGTGAFSDLYFQNDQGANPADYAVLNLNSSTYTSQAFGYWPSLPSSILLNDTMGETVIGSSSSTAPYGNTVIYGGGENQNNGIAYFVPNYTTDIGGNVGIGTSSPYAPLSVMVGGGYNSTAQVATAFAIGSSTAGTATSTLFSIGAGGSIQYGGGPSASGISTEGIINDSGGQGNGIQLQFAGVTKLNISGGQQIFTPASIGLSLAAANGSFQFTPAANTGMPGYLANYPEMSLNFGHSNTRLTGTTANVDDERLFPSIEGFTTGSSSAAFNTIASTTALSIYGMPTPGINANIGSSYDLFLGATTTTAVAASTTNSYGLAVVASSFALNNYSAEFLGGNVGIGTTSPYQLLSVSGNEVVTGNLTLPALGTSAGSFIAVNALGQLIATTSPVMSVSNSDSTLTISPTTGAVVASLNLAHANTWTALQTFSSAISTSGLTLSGITGSTQCLQVNTSGVVAGSGFGCGQGIVGSGTTGQFPYYAANGTTLTATSSLFMAANGFIGIGSTTPFSNLSIGAGGEVIVAENVLATSTSMTVSWQAGNQQLVRIGTSATTISFTNYIAGADLKLVVCNPNATAGALTFSGVQWSGGTAPTQTTAANVCDVWSFIATNATSSLQIFGAQSPNFP